MSLSGINRFTRKTLDQKNNTESRSQTKNHKVSLLGHTSCPLTENVAKNSL